MTRKSRFKKCFRCGKNKRIICFYRHPAMKDGHLNKCKECARLDVKRNREEKKEYYLDFDRNRAMLPHRVKQRIEYSKTKRGRAAKNKGAKKWADNNKSKRRAHGQLWNEIKQGRLKQKPCEICGVKKAHAHHWDYSKALDVVWLCPKHHSEEHKKAKV